MAEQGKPEASTEGVKIVDAEVISEGASSKPELDMKTVPEAKPVSSGKVGWVISAFLAAFVGGVFVSPYFESGLVSLGLKKAPVFTQPQENTVELAPLKEEIATLQAALARHQEILAQQQQVGTQQGQALAQVQKDVALLANSQGAPGHTAVGAPDLAQVKADLAQLTDDLARLSALSSEADPVVSQLSGALALTRAESNILKERLAAVEQSLKSVEAGALEASPRGRLVLVLGRMKDRAMAGLDFSADLAGLRTDIAELPALDQQLMGAELAVLDKASTGIMPYAALVRDFDPAVAAALRAGEKEEGSFLTSLFTTRRTDAGATGNDAVIAEAERRLLARDIAGSVEALSALEGAVAESLDTWRSAAATHVSVARAFDRLIRAASQAGGAATGDLR